MDKAIYLTTEEAADYLRLKVRKLYELVADGAVPCTKITGKWLFPRSELDRWLSDSMVRPQGLSEARPPAIVGGSHDPLLEWALRQSGAALALLPEGSAMGLDRLVRDEVMICGIHLHGTGDPTRANVEGVSAKPGLFDAVVIGFAARLQGLLVAPGNPLGIGSLLDAATSRARFGFRQKGAGAQLLLTMQLAAIDMQPSSLKVAPTAFATGQDLAAAVRAGEIDCGIATDAVAKSNDLGFVPIVWEQFDLVMRRRSYFEPGPQRLLEWMRSPEFIAHAAQFGGYDISDAGRVRLNR